MPATEQLNVTLSSDLAERLRNRISSGDYASESEFIEAAVLHQLDEAADLPDDPGLEHWIQTVGVARYDAYDTNPQDVLTMPELKAALTERRAARSKTG